MKTHTLPPATFRTFIRCLLFFWMFATALGAKPPEGPEVLVVSDLFTENPAVARPTPGQPIYYIFVAGKERPIGNSLAGEPSPNPVALKQEIVKVLASQGYVLTRIGGPIPSLALIVTWGTANLATDELIDIDPTTGESSTFLFSYNAREMAALVGAGKANRHLMMSTEADQINDAIRVDRVYIVIAALDVKALRAKKKQLVWRTRMSIDSLHDSLPASMAAMLKSAAPFLGTETDRPVFIDAIDRRKAEVLFGVPVVVPDAKP